MFHPSIDKLRTLRLSRMARALEEQLHQPVIGRLAFDERLALLIDREEIDRHNAALAQRLLRMHKGIAISPSCDFGRAACLPPGTLRLQPGKAGSVRNCYTRSPGDKAFCNSARGCIAPACPSRRAGLVKLLAVTHRRDESAVQRDAIRGDRTLKLIRLAAVFPALMLARCADPPDPPPAIPPHIAALPLSAGRGVGIDMSTDASDVLNELEDAHVDFVARYYRDPDSKWPPLSPSEAQRLSSLGLKIVAVYEYHLPVPAHFTYEGGYNDALTAYSEARAVGQPAGSAIYFAADFHAYDDDLASVVDYFRGVNAALTTAGDGTEDYMVGVYGSGPVCDAVKSAGLARYSWLSNSITWDDGTAYEDWNIMQGGPLPGLSFNNDSDQARNDYGAFEVGPSTPIVTPVASPTVTTSSQ